MRSLLAAVSLAVLANPAFAEEPVKQSVKGALNVVDAKLSFERVFASPSLNGPAPRGVKLSPVPHSFAQP